MAVPDWSGWSARAPGWRHRPSSPVRADLFGDRRGRCGLRGICPTRRRSRPQAAIRVSGESLTTRHQCRRGQGSGSSPFVGRVGEWQGFSSRCSRRRMRPLAERNQQPFDCAAGVRPQCCGGTNAGVGRSRTIAAEGGVRAPPWNIEVVIQVACRPGIFRIFRGPAPNGLFNGLIWPKNGCASTAYAATTRRQLSSPAGQGRHSSRNKKAVFAPSSATLRQQAVRRRSPPAHRSPSRPQWCGLGHE